MSSGEEENGRTPEEGNTGIPEDTQGDSSKHSAAYLDEINRTREELRAGEISIEEAKRRLEVISQDSIRVMEAQEVEQAVQEEETEAEVLQEEEPEAEQVVQEEETEAERGVQEEETAIEQVVQEEEIPVENETEDVIEEPATSFDEEDGQTADSAEPIEADAGRENQEVGTGQSAESGEYYGGKLDLKLVSLVDSVQVRRFEKLLFQVPDLKVELISGSADKGTSISVFASEPMPLLDILREMPPVNQVESAGNTFRVTLKTG